MLQLEWCSQSLTGLAWNYATTSMPLILQFVSNNYIIDLNIRGFHARKGQVPTCHLSCQSHSCIPSTLLSPTIHCHNVFFPVPLHLLLETSSLHLVIIILPLYITKASKSIFTLITSGKLSLSSCCLNHVDFGQWDFTNVPRHHPFHSLYVFELNQPGFNFISFNLLMRVQHIYRSFIENY